MDWEKEKALKSHNCKHCKDRINMGDYRMSMTIQSGHMTHIENLCLLCGAKSIFGEHHRLQKILGDIPKKIVNKARREVVADGI